MAQSATEQQDTGQRSITNLLADDLSWLEKHCRHYKALAQQAIRLRFAAALVRNVIGPYLANQPAKPLHVVTVGGAGAGKSTVANFLAGTLLAESNPQAGFTRHPIAYIPASGAVQWPAHVGFLGPLKRLTEAKPANIDQDVYQVRKVQMSAETLNVLSEFVVWDCPDMTTWVATGYIPRLVEVAALADIVIYVASDERYNDEVPTQFLQLLAESGKAVVVCLTKMREAQTKAFVDHFRQEVLGRFKSPNIPVVAIPNLTPDELADPIQKAKRHQIPLLNQVSVLGSPPENARKRSVQTAMAFLKVNQDHLLNVAKHDLVALQHWKELVQQGKEEFEYRYRHEYLITEKFHRFDEALVRLLELLELPGVGKYVTMVMNILRAPYNFARGWIGKALRRPEAPQVPEKPVLDAAMQGWADMLRKEAAGRPDNQPLWKYIDSGFSKGGLSQKATEQFEQSFRSFQLSQADEADRTARAIYEELEKEPIKLNTLRGTKFAIEIGAMGLAVVAGPFWWIDIILAPLAASVAQHLVELVGKSYVDLQREKVRDRQQNLMKQHISGPVAEWLSNWPATGGSDFERLQLALKRIPDAMKQIEPAVQKKLKSS